MEGRLRLRSQSGPACGPGWGTDPVGRGRPHRQQHVVPHRIHARRRGPGLGSWLAQGGQAPTAPGAGQGMPSLPRRRRARSSCGTGRPGTARFRARRRGCASVSRSTTGMQPPCPQEDVPGQTTEEMVQDCENPEVYRVIAGLTDRIPYREKQSQPIPKVKGAPVAAG